MIASVHEASDIDPAPLFASEDERCLVGSMLFDPDRVPEVLKAIGRQHFADAALREVFTAIAKHYREADGDGQALAAKVMVALRDQPAVHDPRGLLLDIAESVATGAHVATFAANVADAALKRRIVEATEVAHRAAQDGKAGAEVLADLVAEVEALQDASDRKDSIIGVTLSELVDKHPRLNRPVVEGLFREGETCNVIAASKVGKSWLAYGLALSIINNEPWLGRFDVSPGKVLLIDNELHRETLANRIPAVAEAMGIDTEDIDRDLVVVSLRGNLRSLQELRTLIESIEPGEYKAIIFDAFYRFATEGVSENDNAAMTLVYNLLDQYAAQTRAALVVIHHASKGDQSGKAITDVGSGAGAQSRATDCHLVIRPHEEEGCAVLDAAVRSFAPVQPITLRWAFPVWIADQQLDPAKLAGRLGKGQQAKAVEDQADRAQIIDALTAAAEPLTVRKLRKATGIGPDRIKRLLDKMESEGQVLSEETKVRGNICDVYTPICGDVEDVERSTLDHPSTGQTEGVGGPLRGAVHVPARLPDGGPGNEQDPSTSLGPLPFPEFMDQEASA